MSFLNDKIAVVQRAERLHRCRRDEPVGVRDGSSPTCRTGERRDEAQPQDDRRGRPALAGRSSNDREFTCNLLLAYGK